MNRITRIAVSMSLSLIVMSVFAYLSYGRVAEELGAEHRYYTSIVNKRVDDVPNHPWLAWIGDSTMRPRSDLDLTSYPLEVGRRIRRHAISNWELTLPGLDPFHYYFLLSPIIERQPDTLVLAATLRTFQGPRPGMERNYLCAFMNTDLLAEAVTLPFYARGMTIPDVLFCPFLRQPIIQRSVLITDGLRRLFIESELWGAVDYPRTKPDLTEARTNISRYLQSAYGQPVTEDTPAVVLLEAAVRMATNRGIPTLVILSAVPIDLLQRYGMYDAEILARRVAVVRTVVERAGGRLLDLHDVVPASEMRDQSGHLNADGIQHVSDIVEPVVLQMIRSKNSSDGDAS